MMARPLNAFIYFLKEPPDPLRRQPAQNARTEDSFRRVAGDPLATLKQMRKDLYETVTYRNGSVYCHELRGIGSRSHHVAAATGAPRGGVALPLESYLAEVWKSFIFDQNSVVRKIGASPNPVDKGLRQPFYEWVNASRQKKVLTGAR